MADEYRVNRPIMGQQTNMGDTPNGNGGRRNGSKLPWIVLGLIVVIVLIAGILLRDKLFSNNEGTGSTAGTENKTSGYQAVFLTNGQVYFGKMSNPNGDYATLKDIYYLQVTQPVQGSGTQTQQQQQQQLSLVKLGQELHGPLDSMQISRSQILFYEDMREDGKVMQAIREYQKNPTQGQNNQTQPQVPATQTPAPQVPATNPNR